MDKKRSIELDTVVWALCLFGIVLAASLLRFTALDARPLHGDEANQAYKVWTLLEDGTYAYDPYEHHGPTLYYFALPIFWIAGDVDRTDITEAQLHLLPALFGVATVLLVGCFGRAIGRWAAIWAALFTAVSHAMVFYSNYFIQEQIFVFFMIAAVYWGWRYFETGCPGRAVAAGLCIGFIHASKETCVFIFAAMACGLFVVWLSFRKKQPHHIPKRHVMFAVAAALGVSVLFFSSFFSHWRGVLDSVLTYTTYLERSEGEGSSALHHHPWWYYFDLLWHHDVLSPKPLWTEAYILILAGLGLPVALWQGLKGKSRFPLFLAVFAVALTIPFCAIAYKTPWNLLPFYQLIIMLAGIGAATVVRAGKWLPVRVVLVVALLAAAGHLAYQARIGTTKWAADPRNPYVYAHTSRSLVALSDQIHEFAALSDDGKNMLIAVIRQNKDYWPLPWYLRDLPNVGFFLDVDEALALEGVSLIVCGPEEVDLVEEKIGESDEFTFAGMKSIRPGVLIYTYVRTPLWEAYMESP